MSTLDTLVEKLEKEKFWSKVSKKSENDCWEWLGGFHHNGYGGIRYKGKAEKAHRVSWMIHFGDIPKGLLICHKCDNHKCVNPNHLFLGTQKDNIQDRIKKGRSNYAVGERHGNSKLTEKEIIHIKKLLKSEKYSQRDISTMVGIDYRIISSIATGRTWRWLNV